MDRAKVPVVELNWIELRLRCAVPSHLWNVVSCYHGFK